MMVFNVQSKDRPQGVPEGAREIRGIQGREEVPY